MRHTAAVTFVIPRACSSPLRPRARTEIGGDQARDVDEVNTHFMAWSAGAVSGHRSLLDAADHGYIDRRPPRRRNGYDLFEALVTDREPDDSYNALPHSEVYVVLGDGEGTSAVVWLMPHLSCVG
jgi:hypothetical protein